MPTLPAGSLVPEPELLAPAPLPPLFANVAVGQVTFPAQPPPNNVAPNPVVDLPLVSPGIAPSPTLISYVFAGILMFVPYNTAPPPPPPPTSFPPAPPPPTINTSQTTPPDATFNVYNVCLDPAPPVSVVYVNTIYVCVPVVAVVVAEGTDGIVINGGIIPF